jgi:hypothetical protein
LAGAVSPTEFFMPLRLRSVVRVCLEMTVVFCLLAATPAPAQTVWSGLTFSFTKLDNTDPTLPENQDRITDDVWLTRDLLAGLYNIKFETEFVPRDPSVISPLHTLWATASTSSGEEINAANWEALGFVTWINAFGGSAGVGQNIVGVDAVARLTGDPGTDLDDIYLDIRFSSWSQGGGGGFAYMRAEPPSVETTGDYNGNGTVDAADYTVWRNTLGDMVANPGDGADGDLSGEIDAGDYDFWKDNFGNMVPGGGQASAGPEPQTAALTLAAYLCYLWSFRRWVTSEALLPRSTT